ncbi:Integral membrane protein OS=Kitasatospora aureofaciens OX=1894 GN=GCM10010502_16700 PE=4 SV=1 [Kitasatospora aureofaciens]|uniref:Uncharacterized protein n=2 Tax=Kitasatospora aureofaciens TaxID=1894 RepID=A0A8H9HKS4_KITAU|nr:hypothetical protein GCM10010502_16700 [Kitasatospora aureofaciens]
MIHRTHAGGVRKGPLASAGKAAVAEWGTLYLTVRGAVARKRFAAFPLATMATFLILLFSIVQHLPGGERFVNHIGVVRASLPLDLSLLRTPLSLYVPALDLPVWGALAQVFVVFAIAEVVLGRRMTLVVAYACTLAGTLFARVGVAIGPGHLFGFPKWVAYVRDTGPSAAVVALAICIAFRTRAWFTATLVVVLMVGEAVVLPNLAGLEHVVAVITALLIAVSVEVFGDFWPRVLAGVGAATSVATVASLEVAKEARRRPAGAVIP